MVDLERQLRSFGEAHEETWGGPVDFEAFVEAESAVQPTRSSTRRNRLLIGVAAGVVTLVVIGVLPFLLNGGEEPADPVTTVSTVPESVPTTVPNDEPTVIPDDPSDGDYTSTSDGPLALTVHWVRQGEPWSLEENAIFLQSHSDGLVMVDGQYVMRAKTFVCRNDCYVLVSPDGKNWTLETAPVGPVPEPDPDTEVDSAHYHTESDGIHISYVESGLKATVVRYAYSTRTGWITGQVETKPLDEIEPTFRCVATGPNGSSVLQVGASEYVLIQADGSHVMLPTVTGWSIGCLNGTVYAFDSPLDEISALELAADGRPSWVSQPIPQELPEALWGLEEFSTFFERERVFIQVNDTAIWTTGDLRNWLPTTGLAGIGGITRTDFGWMQVDYEDNQLRVSGDGITWELLPTPTRIQYVGYENGMFLIHNLDSWVGSTVTR